MVANADVILLKGENQLRAFMAGLIQKKQIHQVPLLTRSVCLICFLCTLGENRWSVRSVSDQASVTYYPELTKPHKGTDPS